MSAAAPLRAGIIGTGMIGAIHARAARLAGARVVAVAASSPERSAEAAAHLGAERGASAEEVVEAGDIDVVHVCTPNDLHRSLASAALSAGRHVVCEKPLATDRAGAEALARQAAATGVVAAVPFVYRFYPTVREARERVRSGDTGPVRLVHGSYLQDWLLNPEDGNWRVDATAGGASRAFADIGSHWCDLAQFVTGQKITRLAARTKIAVPERPGPDGSPVTVTTEDAVTVQIETDGGATGPFSREEGTARRRRGSRPRTPVRALARHAVRRTAPRPVFPDAPFSRGRGGGQLPA